MKLVLLFLMSFLQITLFANQTTFSVFGYKNTTISGITGETTYNIKTEKTFDLNPSMLNLNLSYSNALNLSLSYINVLINDEPMFSSSLNKIGNTLQIPLNLNFTENKESIKITIKTSLAITGDNCKDILNKALWIKILDSSYLDFTTDTLNQKKMSLWESILSSSIIIYPDNYNEFDLRALSYLYTFVKTQKNEDVELYPYSFLPETNKNILIVGELDKIPEQYKKNISVQTGKNDGLIYSYQDNTSNANQITIITGHDLDGYKKAFQSVLDRNMLKSIFSNYTFIKSYNFKRDSYKFEAISLDQLGITNNPISGTGSLLTSYEFNAADFGGYSGDGNLHIEAKYRPLVLPNHAHCNIYLNKSLIHTQELDQSGLVKADIPFYEYQLMKNNTLIVEFLYFPNQENCGNSNDIFYAQIDAVKSRLEINIVKKHKQVSFNNFPHLFYTKTTKIFVSKNLQAEKVKAVAEVVYKFNKNMYKDRFYYPEIFFSDTLTEKEISENAIIAIFSNNDTKAGLFTKSLIKTENDLRLYNNSTGEAMFQISGNDNTALAQIFFQTNELPVMLITDKGSNPNNMYYLAKILNKNISDPNSNICTADSSRFYYFNINSSAITIEYDDDISIWTIIWRKYKVGFLALAIFLLGAILLFIQRKSKRSTESIINTRNN